MDPNTLPNFDELPDEIWELILHPLPHLSAFESLSLVNKRLLSLTNNLRSHLTPLNQTYIIYGTITPFFSRFNNIASLNLSKLTQLNLESALRELSYSSTCLNLRSLDISNHDYVPVSLLKELGLRKCKLRVLKCANLVRLCDRDLEEIGEAFPDLEELDVSYPKHKFAVADFRRFSVSEIMITDNGVEGLVRNVKSLVRVEVSRNSLLTDRSMICLSLNCLKLEEVVFVECTLITMKGVRFMVDNSRGIRMLSMCIITSIHGDESLFVDKVTSGRSLSSLSFKDSDVSDEFLNSIVEARVPLKSVSFVGCNDFSMNGLLRFVRAYRSLTFLDLTRNGSLRDKSVLDLSESLRDLETVKLNFCGSLTSKSLFALVNNCLFLEHVEMEHTSLGKEEYSVIDVMNHPNSRIQSLLLGNSDLSDDCLVKIASVCPKLKVLNMRSCTRLTGSIGEILTLCPEITELSIQDCGRVKNLGLKTEPLKLKKLYMSRSGVNDGGLLGIAVRCNELVKIELSGCHYVTTDAVKYMVKKCEKLRELNLMGCPNLHVYIVDWMVHTRPSLRKLIPPSYAVTTERQRQLLLHHGCQVSDK